MDSKESFLSRVEQELKEKNLAIISADFSRPWGGFFVLDENQADQFNLAILSLIEKIRQAKTLDEIDRLQEELFDIFKQVIVDLDEDRIDSDSFQSFTFTWETAVKVAGDREKLLRDLRLVSEDLEDKSALRKE